MAGIGFRLHKLAEGGTYTQAAAAYVSSAFISGGPWLSSVISLTLLGSTSIALAGEADRALLIATITYVSAASLLFTTGSQVVITRYLADRIYVKDRGVIIPTCNALIALMIPSLVVTIPFLLFAPFSWQYRLLAVTLFTALSLTWIISVFLSAAHHYIDIVVIFCIGHVLSFVLSVTFNHNARTLHGLAEYTAGQVICVSLLVAHVYREFTYTDTLNFAFLAYFRRYWDLFLVGLLSIGGIWVDTVIHWFTAGSITVANFYRINPTYDSLKLLAFLCTIPASAMFLMQIETAFARHYQAFFGLVIERGTLADVRRTKHAMTRAVHNGLLLVCKLQFIVIGIVFLVAPDIVRFFDLPESGVAILRVDIVATTCQFLVLLLSILLAYLDERRLVLLVAILFFGSNFVFTLCAAQLGASYASIGFCLAALLTAVASFLWLRNSLQQLEYRTFMLQPIPNEIKVS